MLRTRVIPCLLISGQVLVKTKQFRKRAYIGDPVNTVRIFNELEVDELCVLDIDASRQSREPNFDLLQTMTNECFMPLSYGGGISKLEDAERLFSMGFEKVILNSSTFESPELITEISQQYGSQAVIASIDVKRDWRGRPKVYSHSGRKKMKKDVVEWARYLEEKGAGELLLTSVDNEGTWNGYDIPLTHSVASELTIPVIANGGARDIYSIKDVVSQGQASAVGLGSMVVYQNKGMGVLVNFPDKKELEQLLK